MISHHWNRPQPDRQPHRNSVPSVARVRNHSACTQHITRSFVMTLKAYMLALWCFFILRFHVAGPCPSLRTLTFSRKQRSLWVRPAASMPHSHCSCHVGARLQLSRDALCMHSVVHVLSSGGGAQELRELHIVGLRPDVLMCTRAHMNRFSHTIKTLL